MLPDSSTITKRVKYVQFGYYSPEEIRKMSVKEISNPTAFDKLNHPIRGGLYDPALGVQPHERGTRCVTCGQENHDCPGHIGHIELLLPVYNPYLISTLLQLMKAKCYFCHKLRITKDRKKYYKRMFKFLRFGKLCEQKEYEQLYNQKLKLSKKTRKASLTTEASRKSSEDDPLKDVKSKIQDILLKIRVKENPDYEKGIIITSHINFEIKALTKQFFKDINKKCPHCNKNGQTIRKEGYSKFFILEKTLEQSKSSYLNPFDILEHMRLLWLNDQDLLKFIYGSAYIDENTMKTRKGYELRCFEFHNFFIEVLAVTANRFRPENKVNDQTFLHGHTIIYTNVLKLNQELKVMITNYGNLDLKKVVRLENVLQKWLEIQDTIIGLFNSEKAQNKANRETPGIKQLLERKQGLFRMKMMGKRVNFACRSVISPDPLLGSNEVGVPLVLARKLLIPENVNQHNQEYVAELIMNGPQQYPGALYYQYEGRKIALEFLSPQQRMAIVNELGSGDDKVVWRQLRTGDVMLFNRQPSLHKPSIMSHIVRVLPNEQTIRFHYSNCKSYNADFDGDEMNLHFVQSQQARAEAYQISLNDNQYISQTNGKPLRELMQDMIVSAVFLTLRDTFLNKDVYQQLLYVAVNQFLGSKPIELMEPAIMKPKQLWTGKQLISTLMKIIVSINGYDTVGLNLNATAKVDAQYLPGHAFDDNEVIVRDNELLMGLITKNQVGAGAEYGLLHAFHEMYGAKMTGQLMTGLARLFAAYLQIHGFTCGMDDLLVKKQVDEVRVEQIQENLILGSEAALKYCGHTEKIPKLDYFNRPTFELDEDGNFNWKRVQQNLGQNLGLNLQKKILSDARAEELLDMEYKKAMTQQTSNIVSKTLKGLQKVFPQNLFSCMTITGAKGSNVNHSQISSQLGQQELEGRRVPLMPTGRSLPSFQPYDPNPRAGGYIGDRFLTGLRPQEFFFHCMAGREGLIDTAVKTARSGYLQRCLVKHLEGLVVQYDLTVRDNDGSLIQLFYGEDGIDPGKTKYLEDYNFLAQNQKHYIKNYNPTNICAKLDTTTAYDYQYEQDTIMNILPPSQYLGSVSEKVRQSFTNYSEKHRVTKTLYKLQNIRYLRSMIQPGEAVGCIAGQSIGEPSTQMTLNTFHLAGHGEKNVTLGIPRLREILMTATKKQKTPGMTLQFSEQVTRDQAEKYARRMSKLLMLELVNKIIVTEHKRLHQNGVPLNQNLRGVIYEVEIILEDLEAIERVFGLSYVRLKDKVARIFIPLLGKVIQSELAKNSSRSIEKNQFLVKTKSVRTKATDGDAEEGEGEIEEEEDYEEDSLIKDMTEVSMKDSDIAPPTPTKNKQNKFLESVQFQGQSIKLTIKLPLNSKKILMTVLVKKTLQGTCLNEIKGINKAKVLQIKDKPLQIYTEGVNLGAIKYLDFLNPQNIDCNDISANYSYFGVEASRNSIIKEILAVFDSYGVKVDYRHLYLIADYMTFGGNIRAMNRIWMEFNTAPFGKMSFETSTQFLTNACLHRETDFLDSVSSQIVMGRVPKVGSNMCDIINVVNLEND